MGKIQILEIDNNPVTKIGKIAGLCYGQNNPKRFKAIGEQCISEDHGRTMEFPDMILELDGYSAKVIREVYTHIVGTSRLQASTRYIDYTKQFDYVIPKTVLRNTKALVIWQEHMKDAAKAMNGLKELGIPVEDFTNLLPLAYETKMVLKINLRSLIHMFHVRACTTAYWEFRDLMKDIKRTLRQHSEEWEWISDNFFVAKCIASGSCNEYKRHCGIRPLKTKKGE